VQDPRAPERTRKEDGQGACGVDAGDGEGFNRPVIVYLATYPRSGNDLLQAIIRRNLRRLTSNVAGESPSAEAFQAAIDTPGWEVEAAPTATPGSPAGLLWNDRTALYRFGEEPRRRMLLPGPIARLDQATREALAGEEELFFLKLHHPPFKAYLPGEKVIQVVRHPGAALWSLFRFLIDTRLPTAAHTLFKRPALTVESVIEGDPLFGDWSDYHRAWLGAARRLGSRHLLLRFEDAVADAGSAARQIAAFLDLPVVSEERVDFESYRARRDGMDLRGTSRGYEPFFTIRQLVELWERHGPVAEAFGYQPPDYGAACDNAQIRRLQAIIAAAWPRGRQVESEVLDLNEQIAQILKDHEG
jgi:hypothetical protein